MKPRSGIADLTIFCQISGRDQIDVIFVQMALAHSKGYGLSDALNAASIKRSYLSLPGRALTGGLVVFALTGERARSP